MSLNDSVSNSQSGSSVFGSSQSSSSSRRIVARSKTFLAELFERMRPQLKWVARQQTQSIPNCKDDESDIVQLSVMKAIERMDQFEGQTSGQWRAWMVKIVRNQAKDVRRYWTQARRAHNAEEHDSKLIGGLEDKSNLSPSKIFDGEEKRQLVEYALSLMTIDNQQLIRWSLFQCMPYKEIARKLSVSEPTARRRCQQAQETLRETIERLGA